MTYREAILRSVESHGGIKSNELSLNVMGIINPVKWSAQEYHETLDGLVVDRELVEVNYIIPATEQDKLVKVGRIFFPKGTRIGKEFIP